MKKQLQKDSSTITVGQKKRIWGIAKSVLGIEDDLLYSTMFSITGCTHMSDLSEEQAHQFILHLETLGARLNRNETLKAKRSGVVSLGTWRRTPKQDAYIDYLLSQINSGRGKLNIDSLTLHTWNKHRKQLNRREAHSLIEALKSILARRNNV